MQSSMVGIGQDVARRAVLQSESRTGVKSKLSCWVFLLWMFLYGLFTKGSDFVRVFCSRKVHSAPGCQVVHQVQLNDDGRTRPKLRGGGFLSPDDGRTRPKFRDKWSSQSNSRIEIIRKLLVTAQQGARSMWERVSSLSRGSETLRAMTTRSKSCWADTLGPGGLRKKQLNDSNIEPVLKWVEHGKRPYGPVVCSSSLATRHYWNSWERLQVVDGVLHRRFDRKDGTGSHLQLVVPDQLKDQVLHQMHGVLLSGHLGCKKTREKLLQRFYWYGVRDDVNNWISKCDTCGAIKSPSKSPKAPLGQMAVGAPLDRLATDVLGPLPRTPRGNKYILVVTDHFTKWVEIGRAHV
jgi:hypothetical protein